MPSTEAQSGLSPFEEKLARMLHNTPGITLGTTVPFEFEEGVFVRRIGFADIPVVLVYFLCKAGDRHGLISLARALVFEELRNHGIGDEAVDFTPTIGEWMGRRKSMRFTDQNPSSKTRGKTKMGVRYRCWFEIRRGWLNRFKFEGRHGVMLSSTLREPQPPNIG